MLAFYFLFEWDEVQVGVRGRTGNTSQLFQLRLPFFKAQFCTHSGCSHVVVVVTIAIGQEPQSIDKPEYYGL